MSETQSKYGASTALTPAQQRAIDLRNYLGSDRVKEQIAAALPKWLSPDRFLRVIFGAALRNPKILECSIESILQSVMMCAQLGLEPILGRAHLIPYWNSKKRCFECQFQPGYQGLTDLARRSGLLNDVYSQVVYENDFFEIEYGTARRLTHRPALSGDPGKPIGAYAVWEFRDGTKTFEFMPMRDIEKRRAVSQSYNFAETGDPQKGGGKKDSVWHIWFEDMTRKTVVKHSSKLVPSSIEFMEAVTVDDAGDTGRRVTMFQGVPMIDGGTEPEATPPAPPPAWHESISGLSDDPLFADFVNVTLQANRTTEADLRKAANESPEGFKSAFDAWRKQRARKPRIDKGQPRKPKHDEASPEPVQQVPASVPPPEADFPPEEQDPRQAGVPSESPEESELHVLQEVLRGYELSHKYYVLEAKKRTDIAHPASLDGYRRLVECIEEVIAEKNEK
jgi:recombination protein RecT